MGMGSWDANATRSYASYSSTIANTTHAKQVFKAQEIRTALDPDGVTLRESCDSEINPESNAVIIALDVTGSMGSIAHNIAKEGLGTLMSEIMDRQPVSNPHIMFMGVGDVQAYDRAPFQVSQFEPDIRIVEQLNDLFVEGGGGGNDTESYDIPWYFAGTRTSIDCFNNRGKKGYLFTIGDELPPAGLTLAEVEKVFGRNQIDERIFQENQVSGRMPTEQVLELAQQQWNVFHLIIEDGYYARQNGQRVLASWNELLGKRALPVDNYQRVSEVILSAMQVSEGENVDDVVSSWQDRDIQSTVRRALSA